MTHGLSQATVYRTKISLWQCQQKVKNWVNDKLLLSRRRTLQNCKVISFLLPEELTNLFCKLMCIVLQIYMYRNCRWVWLCSTNFPQWNFINKWIFGSSERGGGSGRGRGVWPLSMLHPLRFEIKKCKNGILNYFVNLTFLLMLLWPCIY